MTPSTLEIAFVSSAYNEAENLEELYNRCYQTFRSISFDHSQDYNFSFRFIVANNGSTDNSMEIMHSLKQKYEHVEFIINRSNYGAEASFLNALKYAANSDVIILLCSDLQDPPEICRDLVDTFLSKNYCDAVLACKNSSYGGPFLRVFRRLYYKALVATSRLDSIPTGFHGFGCYSNRVVEAVTRYWNTTDLSLRQCLVNSCNTVSIIKYNRSERTSGISSYKRYGYFVEAIRSIMSSDATASRVSILFAFITLSFSIMLIIGSLVPIVSSLFMLNQNFILINSLIFLFFGLQMILISLLSRQVESGRSGTLRPFVEYTLMI